MTLLEYAKMILEKVSFDQSLFRAEFLKAVKKLVIEDVTELRNWCIEKFGLIYCQQAAPEVFPA